MRRFLLLLCMLAAAGCSSAQSASDGETGRSASGRSAAQSRCSMGFAELFRLAKGREWTDEEVRGFRALDQEGKNRMVKRLAAEAGCIRTEDQVGADGAVYTAFWKEQRRPRSRSAVFRWRRKATARQYADSVTSGNRLTEMQA